MTNLIDEGFLARWSRRKRAVADGKPVPAELPSVATSAPPLAQESQPSDAAGCDPAAAGEQSDGGLLKRVLTEADFADVDFAALDFKSDYTKFMQAGVPDSVRNRALRQLWASDPIMANMDGLHDYWHDFTDAAVAVPRGTLKTAYRIGKGFLTDDEVGAWEALGKPPEVAGAETACATSATAGEVQSGTSAVDAGDGSMAEMGGVDVPERVADAAPPAVSGDDERIEKA